MGTPLGVSQRKKDAQRRPFFFVYRALGAGGVPSIAPQRLAIHQALPPISCCNSPDSYISIMMSDPPTNSPLTESCGMVGHWL